MVEMGDEADGSGLVIGIRWKFGILLSSINFSYLNRAEIV